MSSATEGKACVAGGCGGCGLPSLGAASRRASSSILLSSIASWSAMRSSASAISRPVIGTGPGGAVFCFGSGRGATGLVAFGVTCLGCTAGCREGGCPQVPLPELTVGPAGGIAAGGGMCWFSGRAYQSHDPLELAPELAIAVCDVWELRGLPTSPLTSLSSKAMVIAMRSSASASVRSIKGGGTGRCASCAGTVGGIAGCVVTGMVVFGCMVGG